MYTITLLFLALFTLYIAAFGFVRWDASFLRQGDTPVIQFLIILIGMIFLVYGLFLAFDWVKRRKASFQKYSRWILWGIILGGQLAFLLYFRPSLRYDALNIFDQAVEMLSTHSISETYKEGYFARYTNNYPITILTYWLLSFASWLGIPSDGSMLFIQILNIGLIDCALFLGYRILLKLQGEHISLFYLLLTAICPSTYMWAGFYYTSTLAMPFFMGILLLFFRLREPAPQSHPLLGRAIQGFLLGLCAVMGYKFRATSVIALIAFCIAGLCLVPWRSLRETSGSAFSGLLSYLRLRGKALAAIGLSFLLACALFLSLWSAAVSHYVTFDHENTGFPPIHWVMMGMRWDGAYDQEDELYTFSFPTREEKVAADKELLIQRIQEAGPGGLLSLMGRKLLNTWVDGTDTYEAENSALLYGDRYGNAYEYLLGNKDGVLVIYAQIFRVLQMLVLGCSAILLLWKKWKKKEEASPLFLLQLALLGGMAFHLIWETSPLYSLSFFSLGMVLTAAQLSFLLKAVRGPLFRFGRPLCGISLACLFVLLLLGKKQLVETPIEEDLYCVNQYHYGGNTSSYVEEYDEIYTQTFVTDHPFNRLAIYAINTVGEYNQSAFIAEIVDEYGTQIYYNDRFLSGLVEKNKWYEFTFDLVTPK